jgi:hypothetical protein
MMGDIDKTGGPAFPELGLSGLPNGEFIQGREGMTLRDYFACHAMTGLLAMNASPNLGGASRQGAYYDHGRADLMANDAYAIADELLKARAA